MKHLLLLVFVGLASVSTELRFSIVVVAAMIVLFCFDIFLRYCACEVIHSQLLKKRKINTHTHTHTHARTHARTQKKKKKKEKNRKKERKKKKLRISYFLIVMFNVGDILLRKNHNRH